MPDPRIPALSQELANTKGRGALTVELLNKQLDDQRFAHETLVDNLLERLSNSAEVAADKIVDNVVQARVEAALAERETQWAREEHRRQIAEIAAAAEVDDTEFVDLPALVKARGDRIEAFDRRIEQQRMTIGVLQQRVGDVAEALGFPDAEATPAELVERARQLTADGTAAHLGRRLASILSAPSVRSLTTGQPISEDTLANYAREAVNAIGTVEKLGRQLDDIATEFGFAENATSPELVEYARKQTVMCDAQAYTLGQLRAQLGLAPDALLQQIVDAVHNTVGRAVAAEQALYDTRREYEKLIARTSSDGSVLVAIRSALGDSNLADGELPGAVRNLADKHARQAKGFRELAGILDSERSNGKVVVETVIADVGLLLGAHDDLQQQLLDSVEQLDELSQALGVVSVGDPAEGVELLDRARTLLADRDGIEAKLDDALTEKRDLERRVGQLQGANKALQAEVDQRRQGLATGPATGTIHQGLIRADDDDVVDSEVIDYDDPRHPDYLANLGVDDRVDVKFADAIAAHAPTATNPETRAGRVPDHLA